MTAVLLLLLGPSAGCGPRNAYVPPPPPEVIVGTPQQRTVTVYHEFTGTTQASESVELRARVEGYLESIHFRDGATVSRGDLLFVIDPRPYRASLDQAKADVESKRAAAVEAEALYQRTAALVPQHAASQQDLDIQRGNWLVARAAVSQSEAALRQAQLNLDYTQIHAPISGRIGRRLIDVGNLVSPNVTLLTTIARYDPMYAYFNVSERIYLEDLKRQRAPAGGESAPPSAAFPPTAADAASGAPLELGLADEAGYPHPGHIDFTNNTVDPNTGTVLVRGVLANPEPYALAPGLFARIRVPAGTQAGALLVPERALATDQAGRYLLVVAPDNTVEHRSVQVGALVDGMRVVEEGLKPGQRFVVEGLQHARPGSRVRGKMTKDQVPMTNDR